jgi:pectinesterase
MHARARHCTVTLLAATLLATFGRATRSADAPAGGKKVRIVLAGDSTVTDNAGWGKGFAQCLTGDLEVINLARGGRSSRSFIAEGSWKKAMDLKPDYVLIQFGHNDQPGHGPDRETDPQTTYRQFMTQYVDEARAGGVKPILVTSLSRRQWGSDGKIHSTLQPNADVVKQIATEKDVPLIDLHAKSIELYEKLGKPAIDELSPTKTAKLDPAEQGAAKETLDGTHLNARGGQVIGRLVAEELAKAVPTLAPYVKKADALDSSIGEAPTRALPRGTGGGDERLASGVRTITVAADGSGDFKTISEAIAAVPDHATERTVIHLKPGVYEGQTIVPKSKAKVTFEGEGTDKSILTYAYNTNEPNPTGVERQFWGIGVLVLADDFQAHDLTFRNTSGDHGQALALRIDGDRATIRDCRLLGWQDTLMVNNGRACFTNDSIAGRVDFIYGSATAVFDRCEIHSRNGGHVTAANTPQDHPWGFVFLDCKLTGDATAWDPATTNPATTQKAKVTPLADLGRPWRPYASVTYVRCQMGAHIKPAGWDNWRNPANEKTARYAEYKCTGPGADRSARVPWSRELTDAEAADLTVRKLLAGEDHWDPTAAK